MSFQGKQHVYILLVMESIQPRLEQIEIPLLQLAIEMNVPFPCKKAKEQ